MLIHWTAITVDSCWHYD